MMGWRELVQCSWDGTSCTTGPVGAFRRSVGIQLLTAALHQWLVHSALISLPPDGLTVALKLMQLLTKKRHHGHYNGPITPEDECLRLNSS